MNEAQQQWVENWLSKARHDLSAAKILAASGEPVLDAAIYHCQQAAEKAVKAFLAWQGAALLKTHDIALLIENAQDYVPEFQAYLDIAELLTPYSTLYRYPGVSSEPTRAEFDAALQAAEHLCTFVLSQLPEYFGN